MIKFGITGGSGCGKTTVSELFRKCGIAVLDCDRIAREIVEPGKPALSEIAARFGNNFIKPDGTLDRKALGNLVFSDPAALETLNEITHRYITMELEGHILKHTGNIIGIDGAAIIESGTAKTCDQVVAVLADESIRIARICDRDGLTPQEAKQRIRAQKPDAYYKEHATVVIYNNGDLAQLEQNVEALIKDMERML